MSYFQNKVAIVTGGGGDGIGNALVLQLAQAGATVAFCDVAGLDKTEDALKSMHVPWFGAQVDIGDKAAVNAFVDQVLEKFGQIDILINNAGIALGDRSFEEVTEADFEKITQINYWGVIHTTQRCYPHLLKRPQAAIVNLSSSQGILALPRLVPYCTTKFAVRGFTDALRAEHKIRGVQNVSVHTVHPGAVATNITRNADYHNDASEKFHQMLQAGTSREKAARIILKGIRQKRGRIFISDGRVQDILARLLPSGYVAVVEKAMRWRGVSLR